MEKQHRLVVAVLRILSEAGVLDRVLLIGSWCSSLYRYHFAGVDYHPRIKTRDIDFLVSARPRFPRQVDLEALFAPLGFEVEFYGKGYMKLESDELALEFLAPELGPTKEKPQPLPELKFNAQPLRHMVMLWRHPIRVEVEGVRVVLPHPADYSLHKLVVAGKRKDAGKRDRDLQSATAVIDALLEMGDLKSLRDAYTDLAPAEKKMIDRALSSAGYEKLMDEVPR